MTAIDLSGSDVPMDEKTIRVKNLTKDYHIYSRRGQKFKEVLTFGKRNFHDTKRALFDLSFDVAEGECLGVIGDNGSGKSTLLKILAGTTYPTAGDVRVEGRVSYILDPSTGFNGDLSGRENIVAKCSLLGMTPSEIRELYPRILEFSGLEERIEHPFKTYSAGMQVRLGFSVAIHVPFDVLVVDEVLAVGDFLFQRKCVNAIRQFRDMGKTIVITSHSLSEVSSYCDRLILLRDGEVVMVGNTDAVIKSYVEDCENLYRSIEAPVMQDEVLDVVREKVGGARIIEVQFLDATGQPKKEFRTGEELRIRIRFVTDGPLPDPCFRVQFLRNDGLLVQGMNNYRQEVHYPNINGHCEVIIRYPVLHLLNGDYYVNTGVWPDEYQSFAAKTPYDVHDFKDIITVRQKREHGGGLTYSPCQITLNKLDPI
ncbi:MAG: ABC transporter ATP-binding protein [Deltaproteobacteria bacterium]|nr:ABC transporter ATP-binding protein [Deltaproteobacteria bacterium]MCB9490174.1 ABC transporter ATP-binding protein [Deltaproteobacteria bacterium]